MSDRDYYVNNHKRSKQIREAYQAYVVNIFGLAGYSDANAKKAAAKIMDIETRLAENSMSRLERRDPHKTYNKMTFSEVKKNYPNFDWVAYFDGLETEAPQEINVRQSDFFKEVNVMFTDIAVEDWKTYFKWNLLNSSASYLSEYRTY